MTVWVLIYSPATSTFTEYQYFSDHADQSIGSCIIPIHVQYLKKGMTLAPLLPDWFHEKSYIEERSRHDSFLKRSHGYRSSSTFCGSSSRQAKETRQEDQQEEKAGLSRYDSNHLGSMVIQTQNTHQGPIQRTGAPESNDSLHGEMDHCTLEGVLRSVQCLCHKTTRH